MLDSTLRPFKDRILKPLIPLVKPIGPMGLTMIGFFLGIGAISSSIFGNFTIALILWILNRVFDGLDGAVARETGRESEFGGYVDILVDFVVYAGIPIGMAMGLGGGDFLWIGVSLLLSSFYVNAASWMFLSAVRSQWGSKKQTTIPMPRGIIEGGETIVFYTILFIFPSWAGVLFLLMTLGVVLSVFQRLVYGKKVLT